MAKLIVEQSTRRATNSTTVLVTSSKSVASAKGSAYATTILLAEQFQQCRPILDG
jgi:hypothetical protein